jgi:hypothetical protein
MGTQDYALTDMEAREIIDILNGFIVKVTEGMTKQPPTYTLTEYEVRALHAVIESGLYKIDEDMNERRHALADMADMNVRAFFQRLDNDPEHKACTERYKNLCYLRLALNGSRTSAI